jgi:hypothetical membrane protein
MINSRAGALFRVVALCGMTAPVLMLVLWTVASLMRPGYDQLGQYGSELGTGPNAIVMNANFVVTGFLIIVFAPGLFEKRLEASSHATWLPYNRAVHFSISS